MSSEPKKQGFFSRIFGSSSKESSSKSSRSSPPRHSLNNSSQADHDDSRQQRQPQQQQQPQQRQQDRAARKEQKRRRNVSRKKARNQARSPKVQPEKIDVSKPIEFPATPEMILAYHKKKPILSKNEEWLVVELNEYECLVENMEIIKIIANHSKFFEVEPDDLWQEFFEFVEEVNCYDEIINYDVWQEFRDQKYPC